MIQDKEQKIARPRQVYLGSPERHFTPFENRTANAIPTRVPAPGVLTTA
jgi:hypothetical protein